MPKINARSFSQRRHVLTFSGTTHHLDLMFKFATSNQIWPLCDKGEYVFTSMKLKPHKTGVSIKKTFTSPLYPVEGIGLIITQEARITVQGILHSSRSHICSSCNKKIIVHHGN